jgi:hypothetical protein
MTRTSPAPECACVSRSKKIRSCIWKKAKRNGRKVTFEARHEKILT